MRYLMRMTFCPVLNGIIIGETREENLSLEPIKTVAKLQVEASVDVNAHISEYLKTSLIAIIPPNKTCSFKYFREATESKRELLENPLHSSRKEINGVNLKSLRNASEKVIDTFVYQSRLDTDNRRTLRDSQILKSKSTVGLERFRLITVEELEVVHEKSKHGKKQSEKHHGPLNLI